MHPMTEDQRGGERWSNYEDIDAEDRAMMGGFDLHHVCPICGAFPMGPGDGLGRNCLECGWQWMIGMPGGQFVPEQVIVGRGWQKYAGTLITAMREILKDTDDRHRELMLEVADSWLAMGLIIGAERTDEAFRLLTVIAPDGAGRAELRHDARDFALKAL
jgi:hypothetical protein